jgi:hypothetical protein
VASPIHRKRMVDPRIVFSKHAEEMLVERSIDRA